MSTLITALLVGLVVCGAVIFAFLLGMVWQQLWIYNRPKKPWDKVERRKDNWTLIIKEYTPKIGFRYVDHNGDEYTFFGLVHAEDDYYYGMMDKEGKVHLSSCVGSIDGQYGWYKQVPNGGRCSYCNRVFPLFGPMRCDRYRCPRGEHPLPVS